MRVNMRQGVALCAALAAAGTASLLTAGAASAVPTEQGPCSAGTVHVQISPLSARDARHHFDLVRYTAANPGVHCQMSGNPAAASFFDAAGAPLAVQTSQANSVPPQQINLDATHPAHSLIAIDNGPEPGAPAAGLQFTLPAGGENTQVQAEWPSPDVTGPVTFGEIVQP